MPAIEKVKPVGLDKELFAAALTRLDEIILDIRSKIIEVSQILGSLSHIQLGQVKKRYKGFWSADRIERMALLGMGLIARHFAENEKSLKAGVLRRLAENNKKTMAKLNDPTYEIGILTPFGPRYKPVSELNALELHQVVDEDKGILSLEDQSARMLSTHNRATKKIEADNTDDYTSPEAMLVKDGFLFIRGKNGSKIKVRIKEIRKYV